MIVVALRPPVIGNAFTFSIGICPLMIFVAFLRPELAISVSVMGRALLPKKVSEVELTLVERDLCFLPF